MPRILTTKQVEHFHESGYCSPVDVMSEDEAHSFKLRIEAAEAAVHPGFPDAEAILIVELDGSLVEVESLMQRVEQICYQNDVQLLVPQTVTSGERDGQGLGSDGSPTNAAGVAGGQLAACGCALLPFLVVVIPAGPVGDLRWPPRLEVVRLGDRAVEDVRDLFITIKVPD